MPCHPYRLNTLSTLNIIINSHLCWWTNAPQPWSKLVPLSVTLTNIHRRYHVCLNGYWAPSRKDNCIYHEAIIVAAGNLPMAYIDGLVQERRNSSALAMELRLSCTNTSILSTASVERMLINFSRAQGIDITRISHTNIPQLKPGKNYACVLGSITT